MTEGNTGSRERVQRRTFLKALGSGAVLGAAGLVGTAGAVTTSSVRPGDGFADVAPWLESSDPDIYRIRNATRSELEAALTASGPRIVVFETSGTIDLGGSRLQITEDKCWVAGQTAPSPGITLINGMFQVAASDCVVQHIRSRIGPGSDGNIQGNDSINTADATTNNVIDHCTASWGTDECMSVGYQTSRTTYSNNLIYEGLYDPYGNGEDHNYCTLVGDGATKVALLGNVWAKARSRIPRLKGSTSSVVANNFAYFFDEASNTDSSAETAWVGNTYAGLLTTGEPIVEGSGTVYAADNRTEPPLDSDVSFVGPSTVSSKPLWPSGLSPMPASSVEEHNLSNAGARPADRTANDERIVREIRNRAGQQYIESDTPYDYWIPDPSAVGGYPQLPENTHTLSVPDSGLRDWLAEWAAKVEGGSNTDTTTPGTTTTPDTEAPTRPGSLQSTTTTAYSVSLSWSPSSDDKRLDHYAVSVGDQTTQVPAGTTTATVSGLSAETTYQASVVAVDAAGNRSAAATTSVTTASGASGSGSQFRPEDGFADISWFDDSVEVIKVGANLSEIQAAFTKDSKRLIVFEESGVIDLADVGDLSITYGNCWVAGQTAPSPGITFVNGMVQVEGNNTVVQHVRVLRGDAQGGEGTDPMNSRDGTQNVIFDHCSVFWGRDENLSVGYNASDQTIANCLITEGLENPEENSNGSLVGNGAQNVSIIGTIYAKNNDRNPRIKENASVAMANSLTYYFDKAVWMDPGTQGAFVGNRYVSRFDWSDAVVFDKGGGASAYFRDNSVVDPGLDGRPFQNVGTTLDSKPLWPSGLQAMSSIETEAHNLANAGARPGDRIGHETRVISEIRNRALDTTVSDPGDSGIPNSPPSPGNPSYSGTTRTLDVPSSGLREWLRQHSLRVAGSGYEPPEPDNQAPDQPTGLTVTSTSLAAIDLSWTGVSDNGPAGLARYVVTVDGDRATSVDSETTTATVSGLSEDTTYEIGVKAVDARGNESAAATVTASTESSDEDRTGGRGPITVQGGGADIWNSRDEGYFYYGTASGDFDVAVRADSIENTAEFPKAGLMVRNSTAADAANVMIRKTPAATSVQWRSSAGASTESTTSSEGSAESEISGGTTQMAWQRLVRSGDTIRAYVSSDGTNWTLFADLQVGLAEEVVVGLAVTSHSTGTLCTAEFSSFSGVRLSSSTNLGSPDVSGSHEGPTVSGPSPIDGTQPTDPDGDGLYEDLSGDGELNFPDVNTLFQNSDTATVQNDAQYYDFESGEGINLQDVMALFQMV